MDQRESAKKLSAMAAEALDSITEEGISLGASKLRIFLLGD